MEMKVDAKVIRTEREKRAWSQEHLARLTGLGVRTIQRIEATGLASYESVKAIAAALGMSVADLSVLHVQTPSESAKASTSGLGTNASERSVLTEQTSSMRVPSVLSLNGGKQMKQYRHVLPAITLAGGILAGTAVAGATPSALWWIGPLLFGVSVIGAQALDNVITARRKMADVGSGILFALGFFVATALVAYADPAGVATMIAVLGGGAVVVLSEPLGGLRRA